MLLFKNLFLFFISFKLFELSVTFKRILKFHQTRRTTKKIEWAGMLRKP